MLQLWQQSRRDLLRLDCLWDLYQKVTLDYKVALMFITGSNEPDKN